VFREAKTEQQVAGAATRRMGAMLKTKNGANQDGFMEKATSLQREQMGQRDKAGIG
jgi:hypothetical protein